MILRHPERSAWIVGILALLVSAVGSWLGSAEAGRSFFESYLFAFLFWAHLPLGALALLLIYPLTGGRWGAAIRGILEAMVRTLPVIALAALLLLACVGRIYPWMDAARAAAPKVAHKHAYLNAFTFALRAAIYFGAWLGIARALARRLPALREGSPPLARARLNRLAAGGLVAYFLTASFAAIDWQMSLEPEWYSTLYGLLFIVGQALSAFSFLLVVFGWLAPASRIASLIPAKTLRDLGNLLLAMVTTWAYLAFMQYLIVWSGNLPHEVTWFKHRTEGGWQWLVLPLALFQFAAPMAILLFRAPKESARSLGAIGAFVFCVRAIDQYWMVMPAMRSEHFALPWQAVGLLVGVGGVWLAVFLRTLKSRPVFEESHV